MGLSHCDIAIIALWCQTIIIQLMLKIASGRLYLCYSQTSHIIGQCSFVSNGNPRARTHPSTRPFLCSWKITLMATMQLQQTSEKRKCLVYASTELTAQFIKNIKLHIWSWARKHLNPEERLLLQWCTFLSVSGQRLIKIPKDWLFWTPSGPWLD